jgi:DNA mismatch repair protein MutS
MTAGAHVKMTPMLEQYLRAKSEHPDALLFFRLGDFYEMFFEDAERGAPLLDVTLTTRSKKDEVPIPMCGVPHFSVQSYVAKLLAAGLKVAICDQMEEPTGRGLVDRAVVRVFTPGTVTEEECLDPKSPNYLVAVHGTQAAVCLAAVDLSTGDVRIAPVAADAMADELLRADRRDKRPSFRKARTLPARVIGAPNTPNTPDAPYTGRTKHLSALP